MHSGTVPGLPVEREPSRQGSTYDFAKFSKKLNEIEKFLGIDQTKLDIFPN